MRVSRMIAFRGCPIHRGDGLPPVTPEDALNKKGQEPRKGFLPLICKKRSGTIVPAYSP
jgi:hypothetical protein